MAKIEKTDEDWKEVLTDEAYQVLRKSGTERAFSGTYWNNHEAGHYTCAGCGNELFLSDAKFDSGTGWPSFDTPMMPNCVRENEDNTFLMKRTEVVCGQCEGHLGHVFDDGPTQSGLRYCINSVSLKFEPDK